VEPQRADEAWIETLWNRPTARVVRVTAEGDVLLSDDERSLNLVAPDGPFDPESHLLIGLVDDVPYFVAVSEPEGTVANLRMVAHAFDDTQRDVATAAVAMHNWHYTAPFCGVCGGRSIVKAGGHSRLCLSCGRERFPRTDPAVIVAVTDPDDRLLLARPQSWVPGRMSLVAGFVEAGEALEQAVVREVAEEVGLTVQDVSYMGSQPWPYPRSLMVGFRAFSSRTDFHVDGAEVESARWFSRDDLSAALESGEVSMPRNSSIAFRIISAWRKGPLGAVRVR
jgi:NAD+ diphosphatase